MRKVTIWSTKGKKKSVIESDATTWESLKSQISNEGYDMSELRATENINKTTLEHKDAALPEGDFTVFLRPIKTKSGADYNSMSFRELREALTDADKEAMKSFLGNGRNWTQAKTSELKEYLNSKSNAESAFESTSDVLEENSNVSKLEQVKTLLNEVQGNYDDTADEDAEEVYGMLADLIDDLGPIMDLVKSLETFTREDDSLAEEADEFLEGFDD